jgi:excisionase family DNA binding protein
MKSRAAKAGFPGRGFATWARAVLLGQKPKTDRPPPNTKLLSAAEAADYCGVSRQQIYVWVQQGEVTGYELPEGLRLAKTELKHRRAAARAK